LLLVRRPAGLSGGREKFKKDPNSVAKYRHYQYKHSESAGLNARQNIQGISKRLTAQRCF
jgi:hypothetical protein